MTDLEAKKLLYILEGSYPRVEFTKAMTQAYTAMLIDLPYQLASVAIRDLVRTSQWPPTIAEIRKRCVLLAYPMPTADEAWAEVRRKAQDFSPYGGPRITYSSDLVRDAVRAVGGIEAIAHSERPEWMAKQFKEAFERIRDAQITDLQSMDRLGIPEGQAIGLIEGGAAS